MSTTHIQMDDGLELALHHYTNDTQVAYKGVVLYVHGATFPADLSIGFKFDGWSWADDLQAAGFDVWAFDFIGFGCSDRFEKPSEDGVSGTFKHAVSQIELVVQKVLAQSGEARLSIVAHSWGTLPAGAFTVAQPDLIERLVLFGPVAERQGTTETVSMPAVRQITTQDQYDRFISDVPKGELPILSDAHFADWAQSYLATDAQSSRFHPPAVTIPTGPILDLQDAWNRRFPYDPSQIKCPVLVVRGEWDSVIPDIDAAWLFNSLTGASKKQDVKISRATHLAHLESGRFDLYEATRNFLTRDFIVTANNAGPIAVIFEAEPADGRKTDYLEIAATLRPMLAEIEGFISVERFQSLTNPRKVLSLSFFENETAIGKWRSLSAHRDAQSRGRGGIFSDYRIRIACIIRDYSMFNRVQAPEDSKSIHTP